MTSLVAALSNSPTQGGNTSSPAMADETAKAGELGKTHGFLGANTQDQSNQLQSAETEPLPMDIEGDPLTQLQQRIKDIFRDLQDPEVPQSVVESASMLITALAEFEADTGTGLIANLELLASQIGTDQNISDFAADPQGFLLALTNVIGAIQDSVGSMVSGAQTALDEFPVLRAANAAVGPTGAGASQVKTNEHTGNLIATMRVQVASNPVVGSENSGVIAGPAQSIEAASLQAAAEQINQAGISARSASGALTTSLPAGTPAMALARIEALRAAGSGTSLSEVAIETAQSGEAAQGDAQNRPPLAMMKQVLAMANQLATAPDAAANTQFSTAKTVETMRPEDIVRSLTTQSFEVRDAVVSGLRMDAPAKTPATARFGAAVTSQIQTAEIGAGRTRIELTPGGLGALEIDVTSDSDGALRVVVRVENAMVLSALRDERDLLAHITGDAGSGSLEFQEYSDETAQQGSMDDQDNADATSADGLTDDAAGEDVLLDSVIDGKQLDIVA